MREAPPSEVESGAGVSWEVFGGGASDSLRLGRLDEGGEHEVEGLAAVALDGGLRHAEGVRDLRVVEELADGVAGGQSNPLGGDVNETVGEAEDGVLPGRDQGEEVLDLRGTGDALLV